MGKISKLLAFETTDVSGSVALSEDGRIIERRFLCPEKRSAQSLAPAVQALLQDHNWKPSDVDAVAVAVGPGSFTGLRVGVATSKMFAWAVGAPIIGVDSLDAIVAKLVHFSSFEPKKPTILSVGIDAQRGDAAVRYYFIIPKTREQDVLATSLDERFQIVSVSKWLGTDGEIAFLDMFTEDSCSKQTRALAKLPEEQLAILQTIKMKDVVYAGSALRRLKGGLANYPSVAFVPENLWDPDALGVSFVAWKRVVVGSFDNVLNIAPIYSRRAAAEEKALAKRQALVESLKTNASS